MPRRDPVFWTERTGEAVRSLRRYTLQDEGVPPCADGGLFHNATVTLEGLHPLTLNGAYIAIVEVDDYYQDPRWPTVCSKCGTYTFTDTAYWHVGQEPMMRAIARNEQWPQRDLPAGAMYDADWLPTSWKGADGIGLTVTLPDGTDWHVDSRASNCTLKDDDPDYTKHKCWQRKGDPRADPPVVTVSKDGPTCAAGAGSIASPGYHGFLVDGALVEC